MRRSPGGAAAGARRAGQLNRALCAWRHAAVAAAAAAAAVAVGDSNGGGGSGSGGGSWRHAVVAAAGRGPTMSSSCVQDQQPFEEMRGCVGLGSGHGWLLVSGLWTSACLCKGGHVLLRAPTQRTGWAAPRSMGMHGMRRTWTHRPAHA